MDIMLNISKKNTNKTKNNNNNPKDEYYFFRFFGWSVFVLFGSKQNFYILRKLPNVETDVRFQFCSVRFDQFSQFGPNFAQPNAYCLLKAQKLISAYYNFEPTIQINSNNTRMIRLRRSKSS